MSEQRGKSGPVEGVAADPNYLDILVPPGQRKRCNQNPQQRGEPQQDGTHRRPPAGCWTATSAARTIQFPGVNCQDHSQHVVGNSSTTRQCPTGREREQCFPTRKDPLRPLVNLY